VLIDTVGENQALAASTKDLNKIRKADIQAVANRSANAAMRPKAGSAQIAIFCKV